MLALLVGCHQTNTTNIAKPDSSADTTVQGSFTQEQAVAIAIKHLEEQGLKTKYDSSKPIRILEAPEYWNVFFRRINSSGKPNQGLVRVYKKTKKPKWIQLR